MARWREGRDGVKENEGEKDKEGGREALRQVICGHDDTLCVSGACTLLWYKEKPHSIAHRTNGEFQYTHTHCETSCEIK